MLLFNALNPFLFITSLLSLLSSLHLLLLNRYLLHAAANFVITIAAVLLVLCPSDLSARICANSSPHTHTRIHNIHSLVEASGKRLISTQVGDLVATLQSPSLCFTGKREIVGIGDASVMIALGPLPWVAAGTYSVLPSVLVPAVHIYHMLTFRQMRPCYICMYTEAFVHMYIHVCAYTIHV